MIFVDPQGNRLNVDHEGFRPIWPARPSPVASSDDASRIPALESRLEEITSAVRALIEQSDLGGNSYDQIERLRELVARA